MAEEQEEKEAAVHSCQECDISSKERVLLVCEQDGKTTHVCVRCLPMLIHGKH